MVQQIAQLSNHTHTLQHIRLNPVTPWKGAITNNLTVGFDDLVDNNPFVKKKEVFELTETALTLSCTWYRLRGSNPTSIFIEKLLSPDLFKQVTDADRDMAETVRDYYSKKLMVMTLKEQPLTRFRQDLCRFINDDSRMVTEEMIPLAYRLPEFYHYDIQFDEMARDKNTEVAPSYFPGVLTSLRTFNLSKKKGMPQRIEYWLADKNNSLYCYTLSSDNMLLPLWEREFNKGSIMALKVNFITGIRDGKKFAQVKKWELE